MKSPSTRTYHRAESAVFCRTREVFGIFSNMAAGAPLTVDGATWRSAEALYQACRFPGHPALQAQIAMATNAMASKQLAHASIALTRPDWGSTRVHCMRWVLRLKAQQHPDTFAHALIESGDRAIVEFSMRSGRAGVRAAGRSAAGARYAFAGASRLYCGSLARCSAGAAASTSAGGRRVHARERIDRSALPASLPEKTLISALLA